MSGTPKKSPTPKIPRNFTDLVVFHPKSGMLPHKTKRGQAALERLKVFDGIPPPYDKVGPPKSPKNFPKSHPKARCL